MKASQEIEEIAMKMVESFMNIDDSICWLGVEKYKQFQDELMGNMRHTVGTKGARVLTQLDTIKYNTFCGTLIIKVDPKLHPQHVSIGRITLLDFLIEEMLLGDEKILDKYDPIPDSNFGYYIGSELSTEDTSKQSKSVRKRSLK